MTDTLTLESQLQKFPLIWAALQEVAHDKGMMNRFEPSNGWPLLPLRYAQSKNILQMIETQLSILAIEELRIFCAGEQSMQESLRDMYGLNLAYQFLNDWWEL